MSQFRPEESGREGIDSASDIIELRSDFEIYREMRDNPIKFRRSRNMGRDQEHIPGGQRINNILKNDLCAVCLIPVETPVLPEIPGIIPFPENMKGIVADFQNRKRRRPLPVLRFLTLPEQRSNFSDYGTI